MINRLIINNLIHWKKKETRKPLILRGARQVGKTTVISEFSKHFDVFLHLNLENPAEKLLFETYSDINQLIEAIHVYCKKNVGIGTCLLFIDEIQFSPKAVAILRYFYEKANHIHVVAAGSLLESLMDTQKISFPVGRVEYMMLRPLSFIEFLDGVQEEFDKNILLNFQAHLNHDRMMNHFNKFTLLGGMPAVVSEYGKKNDLVALNTIYESLIESYKDDIEKYADSDSSAKVIRQIISTFWGYSGETITFEKFGASRFKSREMSIAFKTIEKALLLELVYPTFETRFPLLEDFRKKPKLISLDAGLVNFMAKIQEEVFFSLNIQDAWRGKIAEQIVAQELISTNFSISEKRHFWRRNKEGSDAEVDFVFPFKGKVIPVEVKSGVIGKLKSLHYFMDECPHDIAVRVWSNQFSIDHVKTPSGKEFQLINVPFYYVCQLEKLLVRIEEDKIVN